MLLFNAEDERKNITSGLNLKENAALIKSTASLNSCATSSTKSSAMESSSIESLKTLLSTDNIPDNHDVFPANTKQQHFLSPPQLIPQCTSPQDFEYFLRYGSNIHNTERYLLAIPELEGEEENGKGKGGARPDHISVTLVTCDPYQSALSLHIVGYLQEENDELCSSQWSSSCSSSVRARTAVPNTCCGSRPPELSDSNPPISPGSTSGYVGDLIQHEPSNASSVDLKRNSSPKLLTRLSSHSTTSSQRISNPLLSVPHPTILLPSPQLSTTKQSLLLSPSSSSLQLKEGWNSGPALLLTTTEAAPTAFGHLAFDIPGLPAIDSEDTDHSTRTTPENTPADAATTPCEDNNSGQNDCCKVNKPANFILQNKMERITNLTVSGNSARPSQLLNHSNDWEQSEIVVDGLLDTITNEETCSLNSTSISINHSRDSVLDFSICSNPIDEAAIMEEQLAASGELNDNDVSQVVPPLVGVLSSGVAKDTGNSLTNRTIFTTSRAVTSTTDNNCQSVSPVSASSQPPLLSSAPPIASLEDLTNGDRNSDTIITRNNVATASAIAPSHSGIRSSNFRGYHSKKKKAGRGHTEQGISNGKDADNGDIDDDAAGRSDYHQQTSASTTIKRYIIRSGWFFRQPSSSR
uniref:Uncharacterized protein n=1 Tax=Setaria digitata TaxID=48799 RepID=A0A915PNU4_9BILA